MPQQVAMHAKGAELLNDPTFWCFITMLVAEGEIGRLAPGAMADMIVLDLASTPGIAQRSAVASDIWEALFPTIMMGDDRAIAATYVAGRRMKG